jgi:hypothetical protein
MARARTAVIKESFMIAGSPFDIYCSPFAIRPKLRMKGRWCGPV